MIANCDFSLSSQLLDIDYAGAANTQHAQIAIFKFVIYLEKPETQLFYYAIKTRPTVYRACSTACSNASGLSYVIGRLHVSPK